MADLFPALDQSQAQKKVSCPQLTTVTTLLDIRKYDFAEQFSRLQNPDFQEKSQSLGIVLGNVNKVLQWRDGERIEGRC